MTPKNRTELKSLFQNHSHLSAAHFAELINSSVNQRDDHFHGVWKPGQIYRKGDIVYDQRMLWEMQAETELCAKEDNRPGTGTQWSSPVQELGQKVDKLQQEVTTLRQELTAYQQQRELQWQQLLKYLTLLSVGVVAALVWMVGGSIYTVFAGTG
jgi:hypothetical protein